MSWVDKLITIAWVIGIIVVQARIQADWFAEGKSIDHVGKALIYALMCLPPVVFFIATGHSWNCLYGVPAIALTGRAAFFDGILNYFRVPRRNWWYNGHPEIPDNSTKSWFDHLENQLSAFWLKVLKVGYIVVFILIIIIL